MAKYVVFFTYTSDSWERLIKNPEFDRSRRDASAG